MNSRALAAIALANIIYHKQSLPAALTTLFEHHPISDSAFIQEICYGTVRYFFQLDFLAQQLLNKPLKAKDNDLYALLLAGFYQLLYMRTPDHAAISETVNAADHLGKNWAKGLINAVLRNLQRSKIALSESCKKNNTALYSHPAWLLEKIKGYYPNDWENILTGNNQQAPLSLRINQLNINCDAYLELLQTANISAKPHPFSKVAINLDKACDITTLPGFKEGWISAQDVAAQLAAPLLQLQPDLRVLDACAAPGGKTSHLLEMEPSLEVVALDKDANRLITLQENLQRLKLTAQIKCADAAFPKNWWDGKKFHRILLDAPCSATGVIRRHPDIKLLRTTGDIKKLTTIQLALLRSLWPLLEENGILLYATCSILPEENQQLLSTFLQTTPDAKELLIEEKWGNTASVGKQILPGEANMDGFYYARLQKII